MKKIILLLMAAVTAVQVQAQNINPEVDNLPSRSAEPTPASPYTGWCIDVNVSGGGLWQSLTTINQAAYYTNAVNANIGTPRFRNGVSRGLDVQCGYFFGAKRHFGVGMGLMYMYQQGDLEMDNFHVEYRSTDYFNNTFRQVLTSNGKVRESLGIHNLNIPIVFKYQVWFSKKVGFTADAGLLINLMERINYNTNSSFDYEAIYQYSGTQGGIVPVYDNSPTPDANDLLITRKYATEQKSDVQTYFNDLRSRGYNVGLGVKPSNNSGSVDYSGSVGLLLRPAINFALSDNVSLNLGMYYIYQNFTNGTPSNYRVTDKVGTYNSMLNTTSSAANHSFGLNLGVRFSFTKRKAAPQPEAAPAPEEKPVASPAPEEPEEEEDEVDLSAPILFDIDKTEIKQQAVPILEKAVKEMSNNNKSSLIINGYTDNTGDPNYNKKLSVKRAAAVKKYLTRKGVPQQKLKTVGHGLKQPAASNSSPKGRMLNRRVIMKLKTDK